MQLTVRRTACHLPQETSDSTPAPERMHRMQSVGPRAISGAALQSVGPRMQSVGPRTQLCLVSLAPSPAPALTLSSI